MSGVAAVPALWRAATVIGLGMFPLGEGNAAVPVGLALGMHPVTVVCLSVLGTSTQTLLVRFCVSRLLTLPRVAAWWQRRSTGRIGRLFARDGVAWVVLVGIPWLGGVPTAFGAELAGIGLARYARWAIGGLMLHASILALLIELGLKATGKR